MFPMSPKYIQQKENGHADPIDSIRYQHQTGQLNWLTTKTRPDIAYAVGHLQRQNATPDKNDLEAYKSLVRYLKKSKQYGIKLGKNHEEGLKVYVDASFNDNPDGKSTEGHVIMYAGAPISWSSKKQTFVSTSSTISEFTAFTEAIKEAIWVKQLLVALGIEKEGAIPIYSDSINALELLKKEGYSKSTRWVDNKYFYIRDELNKGTIEIHWIEGNKNPADGFTKPLERVKFEMFKDLVGMEEI